AIHYWRLRHYAVAASAVALWTILSGVPTDIVDTPLFVRMTPVVWWDYPFWVTGAVLVGLLAATYVPTARAERLDGAQGEKLLGGGLLSVFAVGCPVCNKLVVLALGTGGTMTYFAPLQPVLGFVSVGLLLYALRARLSAAEACPVDLSETENRMKESA
ncbi:MAG: hypothetical protein M3518_00985, partial [Actinomycetota bacterium]|nr:hypothetical protein [Actinomycetota bacterium]